MIINMKSVHTLLRMCKIFEKPYFSGQPSLFRALSKAAVKPPSLGTFNFLIPTKIYSGNQRHEFSLIKKYEKMTKHR